MTYDPKDDEEEDMCIECCTNCLPIRVSKWSRGFKCKCGATWRADRSAKERREYEEWHKANRKAKRATRKKVKELG